MSWYRLQAPAHARAPASAASGGGSGRRRGKGAPRFEASSVPFAVLRGGGSGLTLLQKGVWEPACRGLFLHV